MMTKKMSVNPSKTKKLKCMIFVLFLINHFTLGLCFACQANCYTKLFDGQLIVTDILILDNIVVGNDIILPSRSNVLHVQIGAYAKNPRQLEIK